MREILARLNSIFCLTKQERTVLVFLVAALVVGNSILFFKRRDEHFAQDLVTSDRFSLDELIQKSDSLAKDGKDYLKININTATIEELTLLPGVGRATARRIVEYRDNFGPFRSPEDLINVKGIGETKYSNIKESITVSLQMPSSHGEDR
jgi:comEA protein